MWRQGDVLIEAVKEVPAAARRVNGLVLAEGDATGQRHRVKGRKSARLFRHAGNLFLKVLAEEAEIVHPEHDEIRLAKGCYRVWRQREYTDWGSRRVVD
ncbi:MAG: hypothetical protein ACLP9L_13015 [Thermoguttaceae bacterium]